MEKSNLEQRLHSANKELKAIQLETKNRNRNNSFLSPKGEVIDIDRKSDYSDGGIEKSPKTVDFFYKLITN